MDLWLPPDADGMNIIMRVKLNMVFRQVEIQYISCARPDSEYSDTANKIHNLYSG